MGKKEVKTNAMRILDRKKISYEYQTYECDEFTDGIETADKLNLPHEQVYKTIVTTGKSGEHYVFVLPIEAEIDFKKAAKAVGEKSIEMLEWLIKTYTNEGETVLDFTIGSGTTGVAAKNLNRKFIGIEMDDKYFEIAKNRIMSA